MEKSRNNAIFTILVQMCQNFLVTMMGYIKPMDNFFGLLSNQ